MGLSKFWSLNLASLAEMAAFSPPAYRALCALFRLFFLFFFSLFRNASVKFPPPFRHGFPNMAQIVNSFKVMHYSRIMPGYDASSRYFTSTAVLLNEVLKFLVCCIVSIRSVGFKAAYSEAFSSDCWKLAIPASLYTLQNTLQYVAVSNLDAATFQVTYQLKILTTAFFAVTILHKQLSKAQWASLFLLTMGVALVQIPQDAFTDLVSYLWGNTNKKASKKPTTGHAADEMNSFVGFVAVTVACILSGLAGIYFEKVLKGTKASLWSRNIQLSFFSLFPAFFFGVLAKDGAEIQKKGFFFGYNGVVWCAIFLQAFGGIVVALCVKFADNIAKNFATSISILISFIASVYFFDFTVTVNFILGAGVVVSATYLYSLPSSAPQSYEPVQKDESAESVNKQN